MRKPMMVLGLMVVLVVPLLAAAAAPAAQGRLIQCGGAPCYGGKGDDKIFERVGDRKDDVIATVGGARITSSQKLQELVQAQPPGTGLTVGYTRDGRSGTARVVTRKDGSGTPRIGVSVTTDQPHPFDVKIDLNEIGGPSAGLMFSLGIIDKLKPADLTGGKIIAGTGTIDDEGNVGPIGGIPQKLVGAKDAGAQLFLVPFGNCAEALRNAVPGLPMAEVATVDDALTALQTFRDGGTPKPCSVS